MPLIFQYTQMLKCLFRLNVSYRFHSSDQYWMGKNLYDECLLKRCHWVSRKAWKRWGTFKSLLEGTCSLRWYIEVNTCHKKQMTLCVSLKSWESVLWMSKRRSHWRFKSNEIGLEKAVVVKEHSRRKETQDPLTQLCRHSDGFKVVLGDESKKHAALTA